MLIAARWLAGSWLLTGLRLLEGVRLRGVELHRVLLGVLICHAITIRYALIPPRAPRDLHHLRAVQDSLGVLNLAARDVLRRNEAELRLLLLLHDLF